MEDITKNLDFVREYTLDTIQNTEIKESPINGFGLFATKIIQENTILCILDGQVMSAEVYENLVNQLSDKVANFKNYFFMECNKLNIDTYLVRPYRTKYSYINHSFTPNVKIEHFPLRLISLKNIKKGEELTVDYTQEALSKEYLSLKSKGFLKRNG